VGSAMALLLVGLAGQRKRKSDGGGRGGVKGAWLGGPTLIAPEELVRHAHLFAPADAPDSNVSRVKWEIRWVCGGKNGIWTEAMWRRRRRWGAGSGDVKGRTSCTTAAGANR
jgi:hypothetical protein